MGDPATAPLTAVAPAVACPHCAAGVAVHGGRVVCTNGHSFDIARQGYVSLLSGAATKMTGDSAQMLEARSRFQLAGHFTPIAEAVNRAATGPEIPPGPTLEVGAGTGYYLAALLSAEPDAHGIALDVSKAAARRAARVHPRAASILADVWRGLPFRDAALSRVLSVFAPRNPDEVARILVPGGLFVVVTPTRNHLRELITPLEMVRVQPDKDRRLAAAMSDRFTQVDSVPVEYRMTLDHDAVEQVAGMGPSAHHHSDSRRQAIATLPQSVTVTASVTVTTYRR
ncbi:putative RNA methyltransferase [Nocardia vermiculata]|uniref:Methyltransferase domain-containing protein n=1 Tax=Nocardia vermiculata TaxID=257274 RepID=A0A846XXW4_9NOCA|nr:methyltransferase domain-containing protein [Nocardia vermiculata]NKY49059.1 methyltransferase domain-containing protein [Nocardia vermiculata]